MSIVPFFVKDSYLIPYYRGLIFEFTIIISIFCLMIYGVSHFESESFIKEYNNDNIIFSFYKDDKNLSKEQLDYLNSIIDKNNKKIKFEKKMRKYFFIKDFFSNKIANLDTLTINFKERF
jgi:hypothetical protein